MRRTEAISLLRAHRSEFARLFHVSRLSLFGSFARDEATEASDIDVLVEFAGPTRFDDFMGLKLRLEELLGRRVDLVTRKALRSRLRSSILRDLIDVA